MSKTQHSLREQIQAFKEDKSFLNDGFFYFFDWFCKEDSLKSKATSLMPKVMKFVKFKRIDLDTHYVWFKNNCPMNGSLYDDFRICDLETGDVIYTVIPKCGHRNNHGKAELWGKKNNFEGPIRSAENWSDLISEVQMLYVVGNWATALENRES